MTSMVGKMTDVAGVLANRVFVKKKKKKKKTS